MTCDLCGDTRHARLAAKVSSGHTHQVDVDLLMCRGCGVVFLDPSSAIPRGSDYWVSHSSAKSAVPTPELRAKLFDRARAIHRRVTRHQSRRGSLLDVGAGPGAILQVFHEGGWTVTGVEPSSDYAEFARAQCHYARVFCSRFETAAIADERFDLITMSHVLEHTESPTGFLSCARDLVAPDGLLYVEVPDLTAIPWHVPVWRYAELAHRFYFTRPTLTALLRKTGWRVLSVERTVPGGHLAVLAAPAAPQTSPVQTRSHYRQMRAALRVHAVRRPIASLGRHVIFKTVGRSAARRVRDAAQVLLKRRPA